MRRAGGLWPELVNFSNLLRAADYSEFLAIRVEGKHGVGKTRLVLKFLRDSHDGTPPTS